MNIWRNNVGDDHSMAVSTPSPQSVEVRLGAQAVFTGYGLGGTLRRLRRHFKVVDAEVRNQQLHIRVTDTKPIPQDVLRKDIETQLLRDERGCLLEMGKTPVRCIFYDSQWDVFAIAPNQPITTQTITEYLRDTAGKGETYDWRAKLYHGYLGIRLSDRRHPHTEELVANAKPRLDNICRVSGELEQGTNKLRLRITVASDLTRESERLGLLKEAGFTDIETFPSEVVLAEPSVITASLDAPKHFEDIFDAAMRFATTLRLCPVDIFVLKEDELTERRRTIVPVQIRAKQ